MVWHWYCLLQCNVADENQLSFLYQESFLLWVQRLLKRKTRLWHESLMQIGVYFEQENQSNFYCDQADSLK